MLNYLLKRYNFEVPTIDMDFAFEKIRTMRKKKIGDDIILSHLLFENVYQKVVIENISTFINPSEIGFATDYIQKIRLYELDKIQHNYSHVELDNLREDNIKKRKKLASMLLQRTSLDELTKLAFNLN